MKSYDKQKDRATLWAFSSQNHPVTLVHDQGCQMVCFKTKNPNLIKKFQGLKLEIVDIFYGHLA
jgi:hypothetical protein